MEGSCLPSICKMKFGISVTTGISEILAAMLLVKHMMHQPYPELPQNRRVFCRLLSAATLVSILQSCFLITADIDIMTYILLSCMYCMLLAAAWIDWKEQIVPNKLVLSGLIVRVFLLMAECIRAQELAFRILRRNVLSLLIVFLVLMVIAVMSRYSIGFGDVKLMCVMTLYCGLQRMYNYFFTALLAAALVSLYLLIVKKRGRQYRMAFVPYLYIGYLVTTVLAGG